MLEHETLKSLLLQDHSASVSFSMETRVHHFQIYLEPQSQLRSNFIPRPHMTITPLLFSKLSPTTTTSTSKLLQTLKTKPFSPSVTKLSFTKLRAASREAAQQLKDSWLDSLTCPLPISTFDQEGPQLTQNGIVGRGRGNWVIGVDPDVSGAIALLKTDDGFNYTAQVFDSPHLQVMVGKRARKRLDAKSMVQLLQHFDAPFGTVAYIEQSTPYPKDGKMGWWSGGFGYGLWIGVLVASGFSVIPVSSFTWKNEFQLSGNGATKDDSRRIASTLFPSMSSLLQRKKDHGRAEALLIAAYGKDLKMKSASSCMEEELP